MRKCHLRAYNIICWRYLFVGMWVFIPLNYWRYIRQQSNLQDLLNLKKKARLGKTSPFFSSIKVDFLWIELDVHKHTRGQNYRQFVVIQTKKRNSILRLKNWLEQFNFYTNVPVQFSPRICLIFAWNQKKNQGNSQFEMRKILSIKIQHVGEISQHWNVYVVTFFCTGNDELVFLGTFSLRFFCKMWHCWLRHVFFNFHCN